MPRTTEFWNPVQRHFPKQRLNGDTLSLDETEPNETKQLNLRQADSVVYQVHRPMSPIPKKLFSLSGMLRIGLRVFHGRAKFEKRNGTRRILPTVGLILISLGAASNLLCQNPNGGESASDSKPDLKGRKVFEGKCATCHGLDGRGGEHAPDIVRRAAVKALSNDALLDLIHEGITEAGMPGFPSLADEDARALVAYLRFMQGRSSANPATGDPARGHDLFFGKAGCSSCHQIGRREQFVAGDLAGFARDHPADEIRDAILRPDGGPLETVTAVARDGRKFSGTIRNEDNASLQLQDGDGRFVLLMKSSLVSVQRKIGDAMPADYGKRLASGELDDLVSYILRESRPPDSPASSSAEGHAQD
jgi:cytochrome c oxidase cbb3-type subunit 3